MEQNLPAQDSIVSVNNQNLNAKPDKPKRKLHIPKLAILIGFFIVLLVLMEGGLFLAKKSSSQNTNYTPSPVALASPSPDPTADWQTYKGDGFSFMYPADWSVDDSKPTIITIGPISTTNHIGATVPEYVSPYITLTITTAPLNTDFIKYSNLDAKDGAVWENITINNIEGSIVTHQSCEGGPCRNVYFQKDNKVYNFFEQNDLKELEQILSTFQFIEPNLSCTPRPSCLDSIPACKLPITEDMCPPSPKPTSSDTQTFCTMDAKICPDGKTSVGRSGPNCEFAKCPGE